MGEAVDRTGTFRAEVISYGMKKYDSGSVAVNLVFRLTQWWYDGENESEWWDWTTYGQEVFGSFFVVKSNGDLNPKPIEQLIEHLGWDGNFDSIVNGTWEPTHCQVTVKEEIYKGETQFKARWISDYDTEPRSGLQTLSPEESKALNTKFGGQIRALAGDKIRSAKKPSGPPPSTPPSAPAPPTPAAPVNGQTGPGGDIPF